MISGGLNIREKLQTVAMSLKWALLYYPMIDSIHFGTHVGHLAFLRAKVWNLETRDTSETVLVAGHGMKIAAGDMVLW